jgi:hypothetical protein
MNNEQHREDTKYKQWQDGMYVMLDDLTDPLDLQGYALAVVENSLRDSLYFVNGRLFNNCSWTDCLGVLDLRSGLWFAGDKEYMLLKLTRAQALYIATGNVNI